MNNTKYFIFSFLLFISSFAQARALHVYAAASLSNVLQTVAQEMKKDKDIVFNFDASSKMAKQIESGAPADVFFSADMEWMDYLVKAGRIDEKTRVDLLNNKIVVIVPVDSKFKPLKASDLTSNSYKHIALAGEAVPAGKSARAALISERVMDKIKKRIVNADNVRVALTWVAQHEAEVGVVYATDVMIEPKVKMAFGFDEGSYPKITYPLAMVKSSGESAKAKAFIDYCQSEKGKKIFRAAGFIVP